MFQAQMLLCSSPSQPVFSPWFPRQGDNLRFTFELVANGASANLSVQIYHKNSDDTGNGATLGSALASTGLGRYVAEVSACKELVRYSFDPGTTSGGWVLFRVLAPVWFDAAK